MQELTHHASETSGLGAAGVLPHYASAFVQNYGATGRCHNWEYRFRYEKYRRMYRQYLFEATKRFNVRVLSWLVTSNHTHLLVTSGAQRQTLCVPIH